MSNWYDDMEKAEQEYEAEMQDEAYQQGRADREKEVLNYLVDNGYIRYGFDAEYLSEQLK